MLWDFAAHDPLMRQVRAVLDALAAGRPSREIEHRQVDCKEEPGRRDRQGNVLPGTRENEAAAQYLAGELAYLANTPGGGAIILGVADAGDRIGTELDAEWLRRRVFQLTQRQLTISAHSVAFDGVRLLVLVAPAAIEPIRYQGRLKWRIADHCEEVDASSWAVEAQRRAGYDWSAQPSGRTPADVNAHAVEVARGYLTTAAERGDEAAADLAAATTPDLLRRLNVLHADSTLTQAGALLFVGTPDVGIDYVRRDAAGTDSTHRERSRRALLVQLEAAETAANAANRIVHVADGFAHGQMRAIPPRALREAIVNGIVHRDWHSPQPTVVEHVGDSLTVTSPGGFIGGIAPTNIITHPSAPRYRSLAEVMTALRLSEREGIGVDRMVGDMLARGHRTPDIAELDGPYVRVALVGGAPDEAVLVFLASLVPHAVARSVDTLLLLTHLIRCGWVDVTQAAPVLQRSTVETDAALAQLAGAAAAGEPVIVPVRGVPAEAPPAYRLGDTARAMLGSKVAHLATSSGRAAMVADWARRRGRVSSTEVADLTGQSAVSAGLLLTTLEEDGALRPSRPNKRGRGFYYLPAV